VHQWRDAETETPALRALGLAHYWQHLLDTGKVRSLREIAAAEGMDLGRVSRISSTLSDLLEGCHGASGMGFLGVLA